VRGSLELVSELAERLARVEAELEILKETRDISLSMTDAEYVRGERWRKRVLELEAYIDELIDHFKPPGPHGYEREWDDWYDERDALISRRPVRE